MKESVKAEYCHPDDLTYMQSMSCEIWTGWVLKARIKIAGRNINNLRYVNDTSLMAESKEELRSLLMEVKEEREITGLYLNIWKITIMTSVSIPSQQIDGENLETVTKFIFLASKITADGDCSC